MPHAGWRLPLLVFLFLSVQAAFGIAQGAPPDDSPVVRAAGGNIGMFFRFGGLSTMSAMGQETSINALIFHQVGMKFAFSERWMLPVYFGAGLQLTSPEGPGESRTDWGTTAGVGFEYHFRVWRRISPFVGGAFEFGVNDPSGDNNYTINLSMGPQLGIEYYFGDRASLTAQYALLFRLNYQDNVATALTFATMSGGLLTLCYYF